LDHYLTPLIQHWRLVALVTAVAAVLGLVVYATLPDRYQATASVLLSPISGDPLAPFEADTTVDIPTELLIATSEAVVSLVADDLALRSISIEPTELSDSVSATSPRDSRILDVTYEANTAELAQIGANTFAANYLEYRAQLAADNRATAVEALNARISLLKETLADIETRLTVLEGSSQGSVALNVERDSIAGELTAQQEALAALSTLTASAGELIDPARVPNEPQGFGVLVTLVGATVAGLVIGCAVALLLAAVSASRAPRNRRASDRIERHRRQEDRFPQGGRRSTDRLPELTELRLSDVDTVDAEPEEEPDQVPAADGDSQPGLEAAEPPQIDIVRALMGPESSSVEPEPALEDEPVPFTPIPAPEHEPVPFTPIPALEDEPVPFTPIPAPEHEPVPFTPGPESDEPHQINAEPAPDESHQINAEPAPEDEPDAGDLIGTSTWSANGRTTEFADSGPRPWFMANDQIPPPPRNKAKMTDDGEPGAHTELVVETGLERVVGEIARRDPDQPVTCLVASEGAPVEATSAALMLVDALSRIGRDVLLVDAAFNEPSLASNFGLPEAPGLSEVVIGREAIESVTHQASPIGPLRIMTTGRVTPLSRSALSTDAFQDVLQEAKGYHSVIVVVAGLLDDAARLDSVRDELDGIVLATSRPAGSLPYPSLLETVSNLPATVWIRVSINDPSFNAVDQSATAATR